MNIQHLKVETSQTKKILGCLIGTEVGDALGLPREGLTARRALRMFGGKPLSYQLIWGRGMMSDDTEHSLMSALALIQSGGDPNRFSKILAWKLRGWLLGVPAAVGFATLRSILKLWLGFPPEKSGVWSAGNGPAMRASILGVFAGENIPLIDELIRRSTRITHSDPKAEEGARLIAYAASLGTRDGENLDPFRFLEESLTWIQGDQLKKSIQLANVSLRKGETAKEFAALLGLNDSVGAYVNHTVPVTIYCWLRYLHNFREALEETILLGGDTDTTGAIVGGLMGATLGIDAISTELITGIFEWPRSFNWIQRVSLRLSEVMISGKPTKGISLFWPGILVRNIFFTLVVLYHGFRRILPPY